ncbi:hypothetical protein ACIQ34_09915 [Ureibacillus sp. NPDC094379]
MHKKVEKKLFNLFTGELTATILFVIVWILYLNTYDWGPEYLAAFPTIYAFFLLEFILLQGSYYWYLKWRQVKQKDFTHLPIRQLKVFSFFKRLDLILIIVGFVFLIVQLIRIPVYFYLYLFLFLFALIEYINYFHIRLSYMSVGEIKEFIQQKGFRSSKLAKELKEL